MEKKKLYLSKEAYGSDKQLVWITDIHANSSEKSAIKRLEEEVRATSASAILIGGDICDGPHTLSFLCDFQKETGKEIFFVLGNHDYYGASIEKIKKTSSDFSTREPNFSYLSAEGVVAFSDKTALVGHDGWADARAGDFLGSTVTLADYELIQELKPLKKEALQKKLQQLGEQAARELLPSLTTAMERYPFVILLTHVPPFEEVCCYHGVRCDANWGPHFVCQAVGKMILKVAKKFQGSELLVLCGHSHSAAEVQIAPNVRAVAGEVELGNPVIQARVYFL